MTRPEPEPWRRTLLLVSPPEEIIDEARNGRMFILVDDEDRENEGDLVIPAQMATPDAINFMAKHGRGLICLALTAERVEQLGLELMSREQRHPPRNRLHRLDRGARGRHHRHLRRRPRPHHRGRDRSEQGPRTISSRPGHVFPLVARDGGVLVRAGHTEAAVDVARLAGLNPSGVICEIMNDDGTHGAAADDLVAFAQRHELKIGTIRDLIAYRRRTTSWSSASWRPRSKAALAASSSCYVYANKVDYAEHVALVKGDLTATGPVLVRMHALNLLDDVLGDAMRPGRRAAIGHADDRQSRARRHRADPRATDRRSLSDRVRARAGGAPRRPRDQSSAARLRHRRADPARSRRAGHDPALQHRKTIVGLDGYGLSVEGQRPIAHEGHRMRAPPTPRPIC